MNIFHTPEYITQHLRHIHAYETEIILEDVEPNHDMQFQKRASFYMGLLPFFLLIKIVVISGTPSFKTLSTMGLFLTFFIFPLFLNSRICYLNILYLHHFYPSPLQLLPYHLNLFLLSL